MMIGKPILSLFLVMRTDVLITQMHPQRPEVKYIVPALPGFAHKAFLIGNERLGFE